ncbi:general transcription factor IIH subunit 4 [Archocentrus centrarchus]|uniref:general transcription factor IIH subunit 4 n=1 Tax=Archocentrus centrarchus TaxID=63155 RepID=UPI0011E9F897|nr:general transcription factor IIH subunit 4-like [Archocentrus centrarchus]XP_030597852.1 general transcription factor IIH subunit 4-like [Archocentrus centrarchus]
MKLRVQLQCKNLHEYLRELNPEILDRLYNHPATCLAVYREHPSLAKNYVMRMLFLDQPLPQAAVALWVKKDGQKGQAWADEGSTLGPDRHTRDIESLDRYAMERWEIILQFMVGSPSAVSQDLAQLLVQAGLMKRVWAVWCGRMWPTE